jgi:hypothetical protein
MEFVSAPRQTEFSCLLRSSSANNISVTFCTFASFPFCSVRRRAHRPCGVLSFFLIYFIFLAPSHNCVKRLLALSCLPGCLPACLSVSQSVRMELDMEFHILRKTAEKLDVSFKSDHSNGYFTWRLACTYGNISFSHSRNEKWSRPGMSNRGSPEGHMGHICVVMRTTHDMRPAGRIFL